MSFQPQQRNSLLYHTSALLESEKTAHAFSTRLGGVSEGDFASLNLRGSCGDAPERVRENYRRLCTVIGASEERAVLAKQVHGDTVRAVTAADAGKGLLRPVDYEADALITDEPNLPLFVFSADCIVVLLHDPEAGCIGAVHAGWRGTAQAIAAKAVEAMAAQYGADPARIRAAIGAGIGPCCFETDSDVPDAMAAAFGEAAGPLLERRGAKWHVDLKGLNRLQLIASGVPEDRIDVCPLCTACRLDLYWSHRKMGERRGVQGAVIVKK